MKIFLFVLLLAGCATASPAMAPAAPAMAPSAPAMAPAAPASHPVPSPPSEVRAAVERAAREGKPLVVLFFATWCPACDDFDREILPDPRVQAALADVVLLRLDVDSPDGGQAALEVGCDAIPLLVVLDRGVVRMRLLQEEPTPEAVVDSLAEARRVLATPPPAM